MSKMSNLALTIAEYLEQGDNVYRIASVLDVPLAWVQEIEKEVVLSEDVTDWFLTQADNKFVDTSSYPNEILLDN